MVASPSICDLLVARPRARVLAVVPLRRVGRGADLVIGSRYAAGGTSRLESASINASAAAPGFSSP